MPSNFSWLSFCLKLEWIWSWMVQRHTKTTCVPRQRPNFKACMGTLVIQRGSTGVVHKWRRHKIGHLVGPSDTRCALCINMNWSHSCCNCRKLSWIVSAVSNPSPHLFYERKRRVWITHKEPISRSHSVADLFYCFVFLLYCWATLWSLSHTDV